MECVTRPQNAIDRWSVGRVAGIYSQQIGIGFVEKSPSVFERMKKGEIVLGSVVTINDPIVTEALCSAYDFLWIDMEHNPLPLDIVQGHLLAAKGTGVT